MVINFYGLSKFLKRDCLILGDVILNLKYALVLKTFKGFEIWEYLKFTKYNCYALDNVFKGKDIAVRYALELNKRHIDMEFLKGVV